jgi:aminomethyltransferase
MTPGTRTTALYDLHAKAGGRFVDFAGWQMPVWFAGIGQEHQTVRQAVGLFDVSHMGQVRVRGEDAIRVVDYLVTNGVSKLTDWRALYSPTLNERGTIVDDLIVYRRGAHDVLLCVNAATTDKDFRHFLANNIGAATIENVSDQYSQIAVQGPKSYELLARIWPQVAATLKPFDFVELESHGHTVMVAGTGYTGERGYELYVPWSSGPVFWQLFMETGRDLGAAPIGLGARDTLRLEAKFCLYGNDIDETTNPVEAGLKWTIDWDSSFLGKKAIEHLREQEPPRKLVGFELVDRGIPREHCEILAAGKKVGQVTSGMKSPTLGKSIGLGYVETPFSKRGTELEIDIRGKKVLAKVVKTPFYKAA